MIFRNPAGAPELACDECGCRWFDRMGAGSDGLIQGGMCYECGTPIAASARAEFDIALAAWALRGETPTAAASA